MGYEVVGSHGADDCCSSLGLQPAGQSQDAEGTQHPDRDAQFRAHQPQRGRRSAARRAGDLGRHQEEGAGRRLQERRPRVASPKGARARSASTTSTTRQLGKAIPYGVYDLAGNEGWVNVGIDHDTAQFAVDSIRALVAAAWAASATPSATQLDDHRRRRRQQRQPVRLWKVELQSLADETGLHDRGLPLPAGHQQVEQDRAPPVLLHHPELAREAARSAYEVIINLIAATTTTHRPEGLRRNSTRARYPTRRQGHRRRTGRASTSRRHASTATGTTPSPA